MLRPILSGWHAVQRWWVDRRLARFQARAATYERDVRLQRALPELRCVGRFCFFVDDQGLPSWNGSASGPTVVGPVDDRAPSGTPDGQPSPTLLPTLNDRREG